MDKTIAISRNVIDSFDLTGVELGKSWLRDQYQQTRDYFLAVPNDDMLFGFRQRAGLPSPGKAMGGWYSGDDRELWYSNGGNASTFGQWLSAFARMARATGDTAMRQKALCLLDEWAKTLAPDGFFGSMSRSGKAVVGHYNYDKMVCGLVDIAKYLDNRDALRYLETITGWASKNLGRIRRPAGVHNYFGAVYTRTGGEGEWYTLSENLYRAYQVTGDMTYKDFAQVWHYTTMWDDLAQGKDAYPYKHAYSHVNQLSSAAMAYAVTGDQHYLKAIVNGYDILQKNHLYATGGFGPRETFFPAGGHLSRSLWDNVENHFHLANFEAPCGTWAAFKICRYLIEFTGQARFGDWIERLVYNGIGACLPMAGYGKTFYYADYKESGAAKRYYPEAWPCCSGTFPQTVTEYHNLIYFKDAAGIYVNLFIPSRVRWEHGGSPVEIVQETSFPESEDVHLRVNAARYGRFALRFRVPGWVKRTVSVRVNGQLEAVTARSGEWASIEREWHSGDVVDIRLPMELTYQPIEEVVPYQVALTVGPVVLVRTSAARLDGDLADPAAWIRPTDEPLTYAVHGNPADGVYRAYHKVPEGQKYWMYDEIHAGSIAVYGQT